MFVWFEDYGVVGGEGWFCFLEWDYGGEVEWCDCGDDV